MNTARSMPLHCSSMQGQLCYAASFLAATNTYLPCIEDSGSCPWAQETQIVWQLAHQTQVKLG